MITEQNNLKMNLFLLLVWERQWGSNRICLLNIFLLQTRIWKVVQSNVLAAHVQSICRRKNVEAKHELSIIKPHKLQQDLFCSYCRPAISTEKQLQLITSHHKLHKIGIKIFQATYFKGIVLTNSFNSLGALEGKLGTFWTSSNRPWKENYLWRVERHSDPKKEQWLTIAIVQKKQCTLQKGRGRGKNDMFQHSWSADGYKSLEQ